MSIRYGNVRTLFAQHGVQVSPCFERELKRQVGALLDQFVERERKLIDVVAIESPLTMKANGQARRPGARLLKRQALPLERTA